MFTEKEIEEIIKRKIEADEKLGEQSGGSDHLSYTSYSINEIKTERLSDNEIEVRYNYTIFVETEFTVYPDNPPMEYSKTGLIIIDKDKNVVSNKRNWEEVQNQINIYLEEILLKIEWRYGEGRSPFHFPPDYKIIHHDDLTTEYICSITLDLGEEETLQYRAPDPANLFGITKKEIGKKFALKRD